MFPKFKCFDETWTVTSCWLFELHPKASEGHALRAVMQRMTRTQGSRMQSQCALNFVSGVVQMRSFSPLLA